MTYQVIESKAPVTAQELLEYLKLLSVDHDLNVVDINDSDGGSLSFELRENTLTDGSKTRDLVRFV